MKAIMFACGFEPQTESSRVPRDCVGESRGNLSNKKCGRICDGVRSDTLGLRTPEAFSQSTYLVVIPTVVYDWQQRSRIA